MRRRKIFNCAGALALLISAAAGAAAQDFHATYPAEAGGSVQIANVSGDIELRGYDGSVIDVTANKTGPDRDMVEVVDESARGRVSLRAKYPEHCRCDASVKFVVRVPRAANLNFDKISTASGDVLAEGFAGRLSLNTASGDVTMRGVSGWIKANSASGNVKIADAAGSVNANTASGNVEVELTRVEGDDDMRFNTASGDVHVRMPSNIDAHVTMSTLSGDIETNFPIEVQTNQYGPGKRAEGRLGSGARALKLSSASGNISLKSQ